MLYTKQLLIPIMPHLVFTQMAPFSRNALRAVLSLGLGSLPIRDFLNVHLGLLKNGAMVSSYVMASPMPVSPICNGCYSDICQELGALACDISPPSAVTVEPLLATTWAATIPVRHLIHNAPIAPTNLPSSTLVDPPDDNSTSLPSLTTTTTERGYLAIRGLYEHGTTAIIDVCITNLDSTTSQACDPFKILQQHEADKQCKYQSICDSRRESFHPFVACADGLLAPAATKLLQHLAALTADCQQLPYSTVMKYLRLCIAMTLVKAVHYRLRGSRKKRLLPLPRFLAPAPTDPCPKFRLMFG